MNITIEIPYPLYQAFIAAFPQAETDADRIEQAIKTRDIREYRNLRRYRIGVWLYQNETQKEVKELSEIITGNDKFFPRCPYCGEFLDWIFYHDNPEWNLSKKALVCPNPRCPATRLVFLGTNENQIVKRANTRWSYSDSATK